MSWVMAGTAAVGLLTGGAGAFLKGRAGDIKRRALTTVADTPGLDTGTITGQALADEQKFLPQATQLSGDISKANQEQLLAREEATLPGAGAARAKSLEAINQLFMDDKTWLEGVRRRGAALGLGRGLWGGSAGQIGTLRLSDQEKMRRTQLGTGLLGGLLGTLRIAQTPGVQAFLGPTPMELTAIRGGERTQRINWLGQAAGVPGMTAAMGEWASGVGGTLFGVGMGGMGGMGGGGGTGEGAGGFGGFSPPSSIRLPTGSRYGGSDWSDTFL
jgi:hypothetical protein